MYYSSGNYEAFARPKKPAGVDNKSAYIIGSGLAALTAACYLVRDGQMKGEHVHILEKEKLAGGACDGWKYEDVGYVMRGGREMDNHFEVMWDLFHSIPSIETEGVSVLDEYYWLNKEDPNYSLCRATVNRGEDAHTDGKFDISDKGAMEIMKLFFTPEEDLQDKKITDFFDDEVLNSNFWLYWRTMFAFENWHSALEMKRYIQRYIHHIGGLPDFKALRFTKYNQYESMILPMIKYLESFGVQFHFGVKVVNVQFDCRPERKLATRIDVIRDGQEESIDLTENDLVFITNGGCVENSTMGSQNKPAEFRPEIKAGRLNVKASELDIDIARSGYIPTVSLSAGIGSTNTNGNDFTFGEQIKQNWNNSLGVTVSVPIFNNRQTKSAVQKAKIQKQSSELDLLDSQKALYKTIEGLWLDANSAQQRYVAATEKLRSTQTSYDLIQEQFNLGMKNTVELLTEKNNLLNAQQETLQAKYMAILNTQLLKFYQGEKITL